MAETTAPHWKQWKPPKTGRRKLRSLGIPDRSAHEWAYRGALAIGGSTPLHRALPTAYFARAGVVGFRQSYGHVREIWRTA